MSTSVKHWVAVLAAALNTNSITCRPNSFLSQFICFSAENVAQIRTSSRSCHTLLLLSTTNKSLSWLDSISGAPVLVLRDLHSATYTWSSSSSSSHPQLVRFFFFEVLVNSADANVLLNARQWLWQTETRTEDRAIRVSLLCFPPAPQSIHIIQFFDQIEIISSKVVHSAEDVSYTALRWEPARDRESLDSCELT